MGLFAFLEKLFCQGMEEARIDLLNPSVSEPFIQHGQCLNEGIFGFQRLFNGWRMDEIEAGNVGVLSAQFAIFDKLVFITRILLLCRLAGNKPSSFRVEAWTGIPERPGAKIRDDFPIHGEPRMSA